MRIKTQKMSQYGLLVTLAFMLSYIESVVSIPFFLPGMKLGLANLVVLVALYKMGTKDAVILSFIRIILVAMTFGNAFSLLYSFAGGVLSIFVMVLLKRMDFLGIGGVSIAGGVSHNIAQIIVAILILNTSQLAYYLPLLLITGCVTGLLIGILGKEVIKRIDRLPMFT